MRGQKAGMRHKTRGAVLLETTLLLPMLTLMMLNVVNFGMYVYAWVTVNNTARALVEYRVYTGVVLGFPVTPSTSQMQTLVTDETSTLPNSSTITWNICRNANGTITYQGTGTNTPCVADPISPTQFALYAAAVSYTYTPLFPGLTPSFPAVFKQVSMRSME